MAFGQFRNRNSDREFQNGCKPAPAAGFQPIAARIKTVNLGVPNTAERGFDVVVSWVQTGMPDS